MHTIAACVLVLIVAQGVLAQSTSATTAPDPGKFVNRINHVKICHPAVIPRRGHDNWRYSMLGTFQQLIKI